MSKNWQRPSRRDALLSDREGAYAIARYVRMSPQKVRRVADMVRGLPVKDALDTLRFAPQAASEPVYKVVASAVANAESAESLHANDLYVSQIFVDEGTTMRRIRARAKGSASRILKRSSHITAVVELASEKGAGIPMSTQAVTKRFDSAGTKAPAPKPAAKSESAKEPESLIETAVQSETAAPKKAARQSAAAQTEAPPVTGEAAAMLEPEVSTSVKRAAKKVTSVSEAEPDTGDGEEHVDEETVESTIEKED